MAWPTTLTMLCLSAVTFYVRFLIALCKEYRLQRISYWVRLHSPSNLYTLAKPQPQTKPVVRAA
jgi:hypothetical protein